MIVFIEIGQIQCCVKWWLLCVHDACWIPQHFGLAWSSSTSTMSSSVHSRPLWLADRVGRGIRCELLSENRIVFNPYFSLFFFLYFSLPIKNQLKKHALFCSMFLYFSLFFFFSLGTWWCIASLILIFFCFMYLYLFLGTWLDTCIFWPAFGSNYLNVLVLQEHCIQCHHGLAPENSTGSLCFSLACIWSFLVSIGENMI